MMTWFCVLTHINYFIYINVYTMVNPRNITRMLNWEILLEIRTGIPMVRTC